MAEKKRAASKSAILKSTKKTAGKKSAAKKESAHTKRPTQYLNITIDTFLREKSAGKYIVLDEVQRNEDKWTLAMQMSYLHNEVLVNGDAGVLTCCTLFSPPPGISRYTIFLEDGLQRGTSFVCAKEDPEKYKLGEEELERLLHANICIRLIDHKDIETAVDHFDAMEDCRVKVTTAEMFSPYLRIIESALPRERKYEAHSKVADTMGTTLYNKIGEALNAVEKNLTVAPTKTAADETKADIIRNGIALFELFIVQKATPTRLFTGSRAKQEASRRRVKEMQTEYRLGQFAKEHKWTQKEVQNNCLAFANTLANLRTEIVAKIEALPAPYRLTNRSMERVVFRTLIGVGLYLLHASKNPVHAFDLFLDWYFTVFRIGNTWGGRLVETRILEKEETPRPDLRMRANNVADFLQKAITHWGCPDVLNLPGRPKSDAPKGFHKAHVKPFKAGGTETVTQPARGNLSNRDNYMSPEVLEKLKHKE